MAVRHVSRSGFVFESVEARRFMTATPVTLATLDGSNGRVAAQVAVDAAGNVFGVTGKTASSNGGIFEIPAGTTTPVPLAGFGPIGYSFVGANPDHIVIDSAGNLFGTSGPSVDPTQALAPGTNDTLWELPAGSTTIKALTTFGDNTVAGVNATPALRLAINPAGTLFVVYDFGYVDGVHPTAIRYDPTTNATAYVFTGDAAAHYPHAQPLPHIAVDAAGNGYGAFNTEFYRFPATGSATVIGPTATGLVGLATDPGGDLFATAAGGLLYEGIAGGPYNQIGTLGRSTDGPDSGTGFVGEPVADAHGDLFSLTIGGGTNGTGTVVELPAGASTAVVLGALPSSPNTDDQVLTTTSAGDLFGTVTNGSNVTIFKVAGVANTTPNAPFVPGLTEVTTPGLLPSVTRSTLPADTVSGYSKGTVQLKLTNTTAAVDHGTNKVAVLLVSPGVTTLNGTETIKTVTRRFSLAAGGATSLSIPVPVRGNLPAGTYTLAFQATDGAGNVTLVNGPSFTVAKPTVTITPTVSAKQVGSSIVMTASVTFGGNVAAPGQLIFDLGLTAPASSDGLTVTPSQTFPAGAITRRITARAGHTITVQVKVGAAYNTYTPTATVSFTPDKPTTSLVAPVAATVTGTDISFFPPVTIFG